MNQICAVCGGEHFEHKDVLWDSLISEWEISKPEVEYINIQQGTYCSNCGNNIRSIALALGIVRSFGFDGVLEKFVKTRKFRKLKLLEINEAGGLTPILSRHPGHRLIAYPEFDMMNLEIEDGCYDMVVHSDTLEHIADPVLALKECKRVTVSGGRCIYTVPIIIDRLSRSRDGLPDSYHGNPESIDRGMKVFYEFGADAWCFPVMAGYTNVNLHTLEFPSGIVIEARR